MYVTIYVISSSDWWPVLVINGHSGFLQVIFGVGDSLSGVWSLYMLCFNLVVKRRVISGVGELASLNEQLVYIQNSGAQYNWWESSGSL